MKNALSLIAFSIISNWAYSQFFSGVSSPIERDSLIRAIKEERLKEKMPGLIYLYDRVDTTTTLLRIYSATAYDLGNYNYTQNLLDYVEFKSISVVHFFNKENAFGFMEISSIGKRVIGPELQVDQQLLNQFISQININKAMIFYIQ